MGDDATKCTECNGTGQVAKMPAFGIFVADDGELHMERCSVCKGTGKAPTESEG